MNLGSIDSQCKDCKLRKRKKRYHDDIDASRAKRRVIDRKNLRNLSTRFRDYKKRAKQKGIAFDLTKKMFDSITSKRCIYCGGFSRNKNDHTQLLDYCGIDRRDSSKGYAKGNVDPCCNVCNYSKLGMTKAQFKKHIEAMYNHLFGINRKMK